MAEVTVQQAIQTAMEHHRAGRLAEAEVICRQMIRERPDLAEAHNGLGLILMDQKRFVEAVAAYDSAIQLRPDLADPYYNLGLALIECGEFDRATVVCREAIRLRSDWADAHYVYAECLLRIGDYQRGWSEFEWRWRIQSLAPHARKFSVPQWKGRSLEGWTILLHGEQGLGDRILCCRYVPMVAGRGGRVMLECHPNLMRLLQTLKGVERFVHTGGPIPPFDLHCPLMSLPLAFGTRPDSIPAEVPYLHAERNLKETWAQRLKLDRGQFHVGLVWSGGIRQNMDRRKLMSLSQFAPLAKVKGVRFYSLQTGEPAAEAARPPSGMDLIDIGKDLTDFADTAAVVANLDLVITVDTSVANLVGAMGRADWVLLPLVSNWMWPMDRDRSPWYPSLRLFRQSVAGDWGGVMQRVAEELAKWTK